MLRQRIQYLVPWGFGAHEDVLAGTRTGVFVQGAHHDLAGHPGVHADELGSAVAAKAPLSSRRGFVASNGRLARRPSELLRVDDSPGHKGGPVGFPALGAMAVADQLESAGDFVAHGATQTTASHRHSPFVRHGRRMPEHRVRPTKLTAAPPAPD